MLRYSELSQQKTEHHFRKTEQFKAMLRYSELSQQGTEHRFQKAEQPQSNAPKRRAMLCDIERRRFEVRAFSGQLLREAEQYSNWQSSAPRNAPRGGEA